MRKEIRKIQFLCFFMSIISAGYAQTSAPFVTTWNSDQIILPIVFGNYDVDINNDGDFSDPGEANNPAGVRKITLSGGNRTIRVRPNPTTNGDGILRINFGILSNPGTQSSDRELRRNLKTIDQWGDTAWSSMEGAFEGCIRVKIAAGAGAPELGLARNMEEMFYGATIFNEDLSSWDVSTITNMKNAFKQAARFNGNIDRWEVSNVKNMEGMFAGAKKFNRNIGGWDVSAVTNMESMFNGAIAFNQHIDRWNPWLVTDMTNMFTGATGFSSSNYNHLLTGWAGRTLQENVIFGAPPTTFSTGRLGREALTEDRNWIIRGDEGLTNTFITTWNTELGGSSQVNSNEILLPIQGGRYDVDLNNNGNFNDPGDLTGESIPRTISFAAPGEYTIRIRPSPGPTSDGTDMLNPRSRLRINLGFLANNQNQIQSRQKLVKVEKWGDIVWTDMTEAFKGAASMNIDANAGVPNLSLAKDMEAMFLDASNFNSDLSDWDVSNVTSMENMLHGATSFNGDLSTWDVSNATSIRGTFYGATSFNGDLSTWNVSNVTDMASTFQFATNFNGDLSTWNVSNVTGMAFTFWNANSFSSENYDALLTEWAKLTLQQRVAFGAPPQPYCTGQIGRGTLINTYNWTISGDLGLNCPPFITTWNTQADEPGSTTIMLPLSGGAYDVDINNNGSFNDAGDLVNQTGTTPIDFEIAGEYTIGIRPNPTSNASKQLRINHSVTGSTPQKLMSIDKWGSIVWTSTESAFRDCSNMTFANDVGVPDLTMVDSMRDTFRGATSFNGNLSSWDVSNATSIRRTFYRATSFNGNLSSWNVSNVTDMYGTFWGATSFNGDISTWNVSNVTTMGRTFQRATSFNGDLSTWSVSNVRFMDDTFQGATSFNEDLSNWDVSSVANMNNMFNGAGAFNGNISAWNVSSAINMGRMFQGDDSFNGDLSSWDVSNVASMNSMLTDATSFSSENYDALLTEWAKLTLQQRVTFGAPPQPYCTGELGRGTLINTYNWTISGDLGLNCFPFTIDPIANVTVNEHTTYISETPSLSGDTPVGTVTYTKSGNDADDFTLDSTTGVVSWRYTRDYETPQDHDLDNVYEITITATDSDGNTDDESWTVTVANFEEGNSPGGVFDGLEFWIKSDEGLTETSNVITGWTDLSPDQSAITAFGSPALSSASINFNKAVAFDGIDDYFEVAKKAFLNGAEDFTVFVVARNIYDDAGRKTLLSGDDNKATRILVQDGEITIHLSELGDASLHPDRPVASGDVGLFAARKNNRSFVTYQDGLSSGSRNIANSLSRASTSFFVGKSNENSERLEGDLAEVIIYERKLEGGDLIKIFSYLSIKYGVKLDTAIPNYVNSDGTSVFANSGTYVGDVIGIAKDDGSGLDQRISKATNGDGILTISTDATFTGVNSGHTDSLTDGQYLIIGNDGGATTTQTTETPGATTSRITREWKVENTGSVGEVNLKFDGFDDAYTLYTDADGDFSTGATQIGVLNSDGEIEVTLSDGIYFALAANSAPTDITLSNLSVVENTQAVGTLTTTDSDVSDTHTYTLVTGTGDDDNGLFTLTTDGVLTFSTAPDYEIPTDSNTDNTYLLRVQATDQGGATFSTSFSVEVTDEQEQISTLSNLVVGGATLEETFDSNEVNYTANVLNSVIQVTVTPTSSHSEASITVDGTAVTSGTESGAISLNVGANTIDVIVTAEDTTITKTYSIVITRAGFIIDPIDDVTVNEHTTYISETPSLSGDTPVGTVTYTKSGNDADDFTLDSTTGVVSWRYTRDYETPQDHDLDNVYEITITATDSDGNTDDESWTVTVANFEEGNSPGGVFDGLEFWIKSDEGLTETSNVITGWTDLSPDQSAITAFGSPALSSNSINFNKAVAFDGIDDHFKVAKKAFLNGAEDFTVFVVVRNIYDDASRKPLLSGNDEYATGIFVQDGEFTIRLIRLADVNVHSDPPVASGDVGLFAARKNGISFLTYQDGLSGGISQVPNDISGVSTNFFIGKSNENSERLEGDLAEVIIYERKLESGDLIKIFSYLSIKYGVKLDTAIPNYVNSDGTSVFANSGTYVGDVIGIAKDDGSGLDQRISKSTNGDGILTISTDATFTGVNSGHTDSLTDGQYLIIGNDGGATTTQATETPGATTSRITREWKVENTGSVGEVNLKFDGFDNTYASLYTDDDGDFSTGATLAGALNANGEIAATFSNGVSYFILTTAPLTTWTGTTDSNWTTGTNWTNGVPTATHNVLIPKTDNRPTAVAAVTVNKVTINSGASLIANSTFSGNITYNRNIDFVSGNSKGWYLMASPVAGETYDDTYVAANDIVQGSLNNRGIATYNTSTNSWEYFQGGGSGTFVSGKGYSIKKQTSAGAVAFTGTLNTDDVGVVLETTATKRFNLLGNPYPSYLNSTTFLNSETAISEEKTLWVWDQEISMYEAKNLVETLMIAPGQGFFVKANTAVALLILVKSIKVILRQILSKKVKKRK